MKNWRQEPVHISSEKISEHYKADVVVVGLGYAGSAAARAAAEAGASVVALESMTREKFSVYGRDIGHINSKFLASRGVPKVDPIEFYNEWMRRSNNKANPALVMKYCQKNGENIDWYFDALGGVEALDDLRIAFWPSGSKTDGQLDGGRFWVGTAQFRMPGFNPGKGAVLPKLQPKHLVLANHDEAEKHGAQLLYGTSALYPLTKDGRVTGIVAARADGSYIQCDAAQGVILAGGDFAKDPDMVNELCCDSYDLCVGPDKGKKGYMGGRDGSAIKIGLWAGGRLEPRPIASMGGNFQQIAGLGGAFVQLMLNCEGKRFCNELFGDPVHTGFPGAHTPRGVYYSLCDDNCVDFLEHSVCAHGGYDNSEERFPRRVREALAGAKASPNGYFHYGKDQGIYGVEIWCGSTIEELCRNAGIEGQLADNIAASFYRYNELCAKGRDEDFGRNPKRMIALDTPPFYMTKMPPFEPTVMLCTVGGLETDENQNVLNDAFERIPGLYATGNCCGRRYGSQYSTPIAGVSIGMAIVLGREAGIAAAGACKAP